MNRVLLFSLAAVLLVPIRQENNMGPELYKTVKAIEGLHNTARLDFIKSELKKLGMAFTTQRFDTTVIGQGGERKVSGENIIVRAGTGVKHLIVGAHSDTFPGSPGANDNGGGVAILLGIIKSLKNHHWNVTVDFCFFDREEDGLVGSKVFVREYKERARHLAMINLDVEGTGEEVFVGPVGKGDDDFLMPVARKTAKDLGYIFQERALYPSSDHDSFGEGKLENISIAIVPKGDADKIVDLLSGKRPTAETVPEVLKVMHTPRDSAVYVTPKALNMSYQFTKSMIMQVNNSQK